MSGLLYVALGGAIGASGRYLLSIAAKAALGPNYPYGTLMANIAGGFFMGVLAGWLALKVSGGENLRLFLGVGVLGGFTTFSAFSLEAVLMYERKAYAALIGYVGSSVFLSVGAVMLGLVLVRKVCVV